DVRPRLAGDGRALGRGGVSGANAEHPFATAELADPLAVAAEVAVAGVAEAAGVGVDDAERGQAPVGLADGPAAERLAGAVELDVADAGVAVGAGGEAGEHERGAGLADAEEEPAGLLFAAGAVAVRRVLLEEGTADAVGEDHPLQRQVRPGSGRE